MTPEERQELLAGYALGSLSEPDARAAERLVRSDANAATELASYHEIVDLIALSTPLRRADPTLRTRVLRAARGDARGEGIWPRARRRMAASAGWAAAVAAVVAAAVWISDMQNDIDQLREESASLTVVLQATAKQVATLSAVNAGSATSRASAVQLQQELVQTITEISNDPDANTTVLTSEAAGAAASGYYLYSESAEAGLLIVSGLPPLPLGTVYQVWLEDSLRAVSGGVFTADANGDATVLVKTEAQLLPRSISVRVAQGGGDVTPEGLLILSGEIAP